MRILHVSGSSTLSGANRYAFDIAGGQADLGHEAFVAMPKLPGVAFDFAPACVEPRPFGNPRAFAFFREIWRLKPDIVHCHGAAAARWMRYYPGRPPVLASMHIRYKPAAMSHLDGLHALADWQLPGAASFRGLVKKVNNWTPSIKPPEPDRIKAAREKAGAGQDDFLVGFVGRLDPVKGVGTLLSAISRINAPSLKLAIVGDGMDRQALEQAASGDTRISFMGYTKSPEDWYGALDLLVMPSRNEPFALVALEAMSLDTPILASDIEGFQEIFRDDSDCRFPIGDADALARAITEQMHRKIHGQISRRSYDMTRFERRAGIAAVTAFYDDVIAAKKAG
ncbi:glycosyltransferase family 4 protein [Hyphomonas oceanitis]|uniref:Glycosyltransferase family 4 domain-containing protein n=1 Tax=Hyphomonas oceanitis SCH89 TaxID=1280953 RepID=A0A059GA48_9PROT|nr:glycosyltransferase family 4 protein [Hyphomonas oceanitis]KDA03425.1 glycosyltransferase family 4 domain-containing protein [Hyphomonas oceanitis SCH89]